MPNTGGAKLGSVEREQSVSLTKKMAPSERAWSWGQAGFYAQDAIKRTVETRARWCTGCKRWVPKCDHRQVNIDLAWARSLAALLKAFNPTENANDA